MTRDRKHAVEIATSSIKVAQIAQDQRAIDQAHWVVAGFSYSAICPFQGDGVCADASHIWVRQHLSRVRSGMVELADPGPK